MSGPGEMRMRFPLSVPSRQHPQPLKHKSYPKRMTIALGVLCSDGVVLGVDLQFTTDNIIKTAGQKLFVLLPSYRPELNYSVLIGGSGNADTIRKITEVANEKLDESFPNGSPPYRKLKCVLETVLAEVFHTHVDTAPVEERGPLHCDVLMASGLGDGVAQGLDSPIFETGFRCCPKIICGVDPEKPRRVLGMTPAAKPASVPR